MGVSDAIWRHRSEIIPPEEPNLDEYVAAAAVPMDSFFVFITEAGMIAARNSDEVSSVDKMD